MNDLPIPITQQQEAGVAQQQPTGQAMETVASTPLDSKIDPKMALEQAMAQIEQIIAATPSSPADRADHIQAVKSAYIKAIYNLELEPEQA